MNILEQIVSTIGFAMSVWALFFLPTFAISYAWGLGKNKTKKLCDVCFREIVTVNEAYKKIQETLK